LGSDWGGRVAGNEHEENGRTTADEFHRLLLGQQRGDDSTESRAPEVRSRRAAGLGAKDSNGPMPLGFARPRHRPSQPL
jgi:hypothetical protein